MFFPDDAVRGSATLLDHLRHVMVFLNMFPVNQPEVMIAKAHERFDAEGNLTDEATREYVRRLLQSLGRVDAADPAA